MENLNGKVGVVTGAASGIGRSMAERFCKEGMAVVLADIEEESLDEAVEQIAANGGKAIGVVTDVSSKEAVENLANETIKKIWRCPCASQQCWRCCSWPPR